MAQNRKKLVDLFVGNISNAIVHNILEKAISDEEIADKYRRELSISWEIAKKYRDKINPVRAALPDKDLQHIKTSIMKKVRAELMLRISKGYENINLNLIEELVNEALKDMKIA